MKLLSILLFCLVSEASAQVHVMDMDTLRSNFSKAVADKELCARMIDNLQSSKSQTVHLAYLGGFQTIWAKHVFNPIAKLNTFKKGRDNIEKAVSKEPNNKEIRFIRLSVQKNAPSFLNYNQNIKQDELFLKK